MKLYALGVADTIEFYWADTASQARRMAADVHPDEHVWVLVRVPDVSAPPLYLVDDTGGVE
jgi:hypothetical protein